MKSAVLVGGLGLIGTLGAAIIGNLDKIFPSKPTTPATSVTSAGSAAAPDPPHAPTIKADPQTETWNEQTTLLTIEPGKTLSLKGMDLYAMRATYPEPGCAGNTFIPYTWQVRDPYPSDDLQITTVIQGGGIDAVGSGGKGSANMSPCAQHDFQNTGLKTLKVEVRYASALYKP